MPKVRRLKYRELIPILRQFGIQVMKKRGKGSHRILYQDSTGESFPIPYHGDNREYSIKLLQRLAARFNIPEEYLTG